MKPSYIVYFTLVITVLIGTVSTARSATIDFTPYLWETWPEIETMKLREKKAWPPVWFVYLPFQNAPGPRSSSVDRDDPDSSLNDSINDLSPSGKPDPPPSLEARQSGVRFEQCLDTDRCVFFIARERNPKGRRVLVELFRTDVPHLRASCEQERVLAKVVMETLQETLADATQIDVYDHYKVGRKHMARVVVDGQDLSEFLIGQGLAAPQGHGRKDWCSD